MDARAGLFLPLTAKQQRAALELVARRGFRPDAEGVAAFLVAEARKPAHPLRRIADNVGDFARKNPDMVNTAVTVARVFLRT